MTDSEKLTIAVNALEEIIDPIGAIRRELKEGEQLNGVIAIQVTSNNVYLQNIAQKALKEINK